MRTNSPENGLETAAAPTLQTGAQSCTMRAMNKRELAKAVAVQTNTNLRTVSAVLDGFTDVVTAVVSQGEAVRISGFAKFAKVHRAARMGRNPATGESIRIKASKKAKIVPVKAFKDAVLNPSTAPKLNRGVWPTDEDAVRSAGRGAEVAAPARGRKAAGTRRKAAAKRGTTRRTAGRKATTRRATTRRVTKKAAGTRRTTAKRTTAKRTTAKRTTRKTTARKTTARGRR